MRPNPDSPTPPNGSDGTPAKARTELIDVMPERTRSAMAMPFFLENTAPARLFFVALVSSTASSIDVTGLTAKVGPNVSWVISVESSGTWVRMVGWT